MCAGPVVFVVNYNRRRIKGWVDRNATLTKINITKTSPSSLRPVNVRACSLLEWLSTSDIDLIETDHRGKVTSWVF